MDPLLIILDLDETLIHASEQPLSRAPDFVFREYSIYKRPGVDMFLAECASRYRLAVWTASGRKYAEAVIGWLFPKREILEFDWSRDRCTRRFNFETQTETHIKDLKKVKKQGYALERVLVIDDSAEKMVRNYGNHIPVRPFEGDPDDRELERLTVYLRTLENAPNVRLIEKRFWR